MPLNYILNAPITITLLDAFTVTDNNYNDVTSHLKDIRVSDIKLEVADINGNTFALTDVEYDGYLSPLAANDGNAITLLAGTNNTNYPAQYGAITDGTYPVLTWTRNGNTATIEQLLLNSVLSNYQQPCVKLTADVNLLSTYLGYVTYSNYLSTKKLIPYSISIDYAENNNTLTMVETLPDNLSFNFL